jgi:short-subunit dehydrogenase
MKQSLVITGATGGLGASLAAAYAGPDTALLLIGRNEARLANVADAAREAGADVTTALIDVRDRDAMATALTNFDDVFPVSLLIVNAGVTSGLGPDGIDPASRRQVEVNLIGAFNTAEPLTPRMIRRGAGQIALVSSLAALRPQPALAAYSASKAGLRAWGVAMRTALQPHGVGVTIISPGFVETPMASRHKGAKPLQLSPDAAAAKIKRGLARRARFITFPWQMTLLIRFGNLFPPVLSDWWERRFAATIVSDGEEN